MLLEPGSHDVIIILMKKIDMRSSKLTIACEHSRQRNHVYAGSAYSAAAMLFTITVSFKPGYNWQKPFDSAPCLIFVG